MIKKALIFALFSFVAGTAGACDEMGEKSERKPIGYFTDMRMSGETGDCAGYDLWLFNGATSIEGELSVYEGNCEDARRAITVTEYNAQEGSLAFTAKGHDDDSVYSFVGFVRSDKVEGVITYRLKKPTGGNGQTVSLRKK